MDADMFDKRSYALIIEVRLGTCETILTEGPMRI